MGGKKHQSHTKKSLLKKTLGALGMVPFFMVVMGVAGALLTAMLISVFTLNLEGLQKSAGVLIEGIFLTSVLGAFGVFVPVALPLGVVAGFIMMFLHRRGNIDRGKSKDLSAIFGIAILVMVATTFVAYLGYALYSIFQSAMQMSSLGSYTGFAAGSLLGIIIGLYLAWRDDPKSEYENRAAQRKKQSRGAHPADLDWWLADFDNDIDAD